MRACPIQHGEAKAEAEGPARPLTDRGHEEVQRVAQQAAPMGLPVAEILHAGERGSRQTAAILAEHLWLCRGLREADHVAPTHDPAAAREPLMLVGHLPHLNRLASSLLVGDPWREIIRFRTGAIVCLDRPECGWLVRWVLTPELAGAPHPA